MAVTFDAVGPSAAGASSASTPLTWTHTCAASATELLVGVAIDVTDTDAAKTVTVTYNSVSMTSVLRWESGGNTQHVGFVQVFRLHSPSTGSALTVSVAVSGTGSLDRITGGSLSFIGSSTVSAGTNSDSNSVAVTSGTISVPTTSASNLVAAFVTNGSGGLSFTAGTSRFVNNATAGGAASSCGGATIAATGSNVVVSWSQTSDFYAAVGVEVRVAAAVVVTVGIKKAIRAAGYANDPYVLGRPGLNYVS